MRLRSVLALLFGLTCSGCAVIVGQSATESVTLEWSEVPRELGNDSLTEATDSSTQGFHPGKVLLIGVGILSALLVLMLITGVPLVTD